MSQQPKKMVTITLDPATVKLLNQYADIRESGGELTYKLKLHLKHLEDNVFECLEDQNRYFFVSYNAEAVVDKKTVLGHLAFWIQGFPSLLYITEQLIPEKANNKCCNVVITYLHEFKDFDEYFAFCEGYEAGGELKGLIGL